MRVVYIFFNLLFLARITVETLIILFIPCQIHFHLCVRFPDAISAHPGSIQDYVSWFYCLCISFLDFSLIRTSFLTHVLPSPSLFYFLHGGIGSACTPRKMFLKSCELCSVPLSLRAVFQSIPYTSSLSKWKSALLKFSLLTLLLIWPALLKVVNSTRTWLLQPRVPPVLTCLISSFMLVYDRSSNASFVVGLYVMD